MLATTRRRILVCATSATLLAALVGCTVSPMPTPPVPSSEETGFDPTYTETPTPVPTGDAPDDLGGRNLVLVVITFDTWSVGSREIQVSGFVPNIVEDNGTCSLTATMNGVTKSVSGSAEATPSSTSCGQLALSDPTLTSGQWAVTLSYSSAISAGRSAVTEVEIP